MYSVSSIDVFNKLCGVVNDIRQQKLSREKKNNKKLKYLQIFERN